MSWCQKAVKIFVKFKLFLAHKVYVKIIKIYVIIIHVQGGVYGKFRT